MAKHTKKEIESSNVNIKYVPMNITGDTAFKCINDDWGVVAFDIRRKQLQDSRMQFGDKELQYNCIYFLVGRSGLTEKVYVGQAKKRNGGGSVLQRLREHAKSQTEPYRDIWERAIVVTGKEDTWGVTELNALEHIFYHEIPVANKLNGNEPNAGLEDLEQFNEKVKQIELYLATLKIGIFSDTDSGKHITVQSVTNEYSRREDLQNGMARIPEIVTPRKTVVDMVNLLPDDVWNPDTTFLDIACKGGEFLKEIYNRLMEAEALKAMFPNDIARSNHILSKQIFGISLSEVSKQRTTDNLNGFGYNIKIIHDYIDKIKGKSLGSKENGVRKTMNDIIYEEFNRMKFDVVISNPPYNKGMDLDFVNLGYDLSDKYCCMITPAKWQTAEADQRITSRMTYGEFRRKLVPHMSHVVFYPDCGNVFAISQVDGIAYYLIDKVNHDECVIENRCIHQKYYNSIETRSIANQETLVNIGNEVINSLGQYQAYRIEAYNKNKRYQVWTNNQLTIGGQGGQINYLLSIDGMHNAVSISRILDSNDAVDMSCRTGASSCSFSSDNKAECESFVSWLNTRFTRFFVAINISKLTGILTDQCFRFVPVPTVLDSQGNRVPGKFDHIYTDAELYKTFNLPQKYIDVIESVIKERK